MKILAKAFCNTCQVDSNYTDIVTVEEIVEFNDENFYSLTCPKGHICYSRIQAYNFELLFDQGAMAILDGYSKESVSSFASSLERFIEHFLKIVAYHHNISLDNYVKSWKLMMKQSERQLGAFYFVQACEWKQVHFTIDEKEISFRNKVIHQGYIPTTEEAINYGNYVLNFILNVIKKLEETHAEAIDKSILFWHLMNSGKPVTEWIHTTASIPTIIGLRLMRDKRLDPIDLKNDIQLIKENGFYKNFYIRQM